MAVSLLERKLAEEPIEIPASPFWDVFKRFGKDEAIAMLVNVLGTAGVDSIIGASDLSKKSKNIVLSLAGPVIEKLGFFPAHFKEAIDVHKTTPKEERANLGHYFKMAVKGGAKSLVEDIVIHDPLYTVLMLEGMRLYPQTPPWLLALGSFVAAVFGVSGLEVGYKEAAYWNRKRSFKKAGFGVESYLESRFVMEPGKDPEEILTAILKESALRDYSLGEPKRWSYHDRYFETKLPVYSARVPRLRLRIRENKEGDGCVQTAQVVYTRASEIARREVGQYRYFPIKKDKLYFLLDQEMPESIDDIKDERVKRILKGVQQGEKHQDVAFDRTAAYNNTMLVSADRIASDNGPFNVVELKTYSRADLLKEVMRFVLRNFPVVDQTTYGKLDLLYMKGKISNEP